VKLNEVRKTVGRIKASLFKNSNSFSIGMLKSHFKGSGLQFKEHQVYTFGDDIRFIDWNMLAKTNEAFVKTFEEERNIEITVVLDASRSMLTGVDGVSKLQASIEITCLLFLLAKETNDFVHVLVIGDELIDIPKSQGDKGISYLISNLEKYGILDETGIVNIERPLVNEVIEEQKKMRSIMKHIGKRREVVILSDFVDFIDAKSLKRLIFRKNLHCFFMESPLDRKVSAPISIFSFSAGNNKGASFQKIRTLEEKNIERDLGKKVKKIDISERYLENFIREMV
jgi:hypothetical protein